MNRDFKANLDKLKELVFCEIINMTGRVYVMVRYSEKVKLGNRGFTKGEKDRGIILAFNQQMNFNWSEGAINAKLSFGTTVEKCYIPSGDIVMIYSPDINIRFVADVNEAEIAKIFTVDKPVTDSLSKDDVPAKRLENSNIKGGAKVIEVDFTKKNR